MSTHTHQSTSQNRPALAVIRAIFLHDFFFDQSLNMCQRYFCARVPSNLHCFRETLWTGKRTVSVHTAVQVVYNVLWELECLNCATYWELHCTVPYVFTVLCSVRISLYCMHTMRIVLYRIPYVLCCILCALYVYRMLCVLHCSAVYTVCRYCTVIVQNFILCVPIVRSAILRIVRTRTLNFCHLLCLVLCFTLHACVQIVYK